MKKILFLDIDGVLVLYNRNSNDFNKKCVNVLNEIIEKTDCEIVISSDWKNHYSLQGLKNTFKFNGVNKVPFDITPNSPNYNIGNLENGRIEEINEWIKINKPDIYCSVDDLDLKKLGDEHFVHCKKPFGEGISQTSIKEKLINKLNDESNK